MPANAALHRGPSSRPAPPAATPPGRARRPRRSIPDDPSNVHHSYIGDHVKFRNLHAGTERAPHLPPARAPVAAHAEQRQVELPRQPGDRPGSAYTYEITYGGSGNRNQTVGDSIFHCHFYPHFAQGMWALWRVHDVFEARHRARRRAAGRPPARAPCPTARSSPARRSRRSCRCPTQADGADARARSQHRRRPGRQLADRRPSTRAIPFFVPGVAGHRPPHPPLDFAPDDAVRPSTAACRATSSLGGTVRSSTTTRLDFEQGCSRRRRVARAAGERATPVEQAAMAFHAAARTAPDLHAGRRRRRAFMTNGRPGRCRARRIADPCVDDSRQRRSRDMPRTLQGGGHPARRQAQQGGLALPAAAHARAVGRRRRHPRRRHPPAGAVLLPRQQRRAASSTGTPTWCPNDYELDDFQVRTPTDIIGQHIHLVKFDVTSLGRRGQRLELRGRHVRPRRGAGAHRAPSTGQRRAAASRPTSRNGHAVSSCPAPKAHPVLRHGLDCDGQRWLGAQTTVQRWCADPVRSTGGNDRTLRTVFTHDHFGPSTHQQVGLYAGLLIEPAGIAPAKHNETGAPLSTNGGPASTGRRPDELAGGHPDREPQANNYREFLLEFADFQHAYEPGGPVCPNPNREIGWIDSAAPSTRRAAERQLALARPGSTTGRPVPGRRQGSSAFLPPPCPEAVSAADIGMTSVNYRNEPIGLRVNDPGHQRARRPASRATSRSPTSREPTAPTRPSTSQPAFYPPLTDGLYPGDPFTPLLRAFEGRPGEDPHPGRRARGAAQLHRPRPQVAVRARRPELRLPQLPDDRHLRVVRHRDPARPQPRSGGKFGGLPLQAERRDRSRSGTAPGACSGSTATTTASRPATAKFDLTPLDHLQPHGQVTDSRHGLRGNHRHAGPGRRRPGLRRERRPSGRRRSTASSARTRLRGARPFPRSILRRPVPSAATGRIQCRLPGRRSSPDVQHRRRGSQRSLAQRSRVMSGLIYNSRSDSVTGPSGCLHRAALRPDGDHVRLSHRPDLRGLAGASAAQPERTARAARPARTGRRVPQGGVHATSCPQLH